MLLYDTRPSYMSDFTLYNMFQVKIMNDYTITQYQIISSLSALYSRGLGLHSQEGSDG